MSLCIISGWQKSGIAPKSLGLYEVGMESETPLPPTVHEDMNSTLFDGVSGTYEQQVAGAANVSIDYVTEKKAEYLLSEIEARLGDRQDLQVLDIGCGVGLIHPHIVPSVGSLSATDLSRESLDLAVGRGLDVNYTPMDGMNLPFGDASFDVAYTICVMHHVPPPRWGQFTREMRRVLKPGGLGIVFEHNPYNPVTRIIVNRCEFDADAVLLNARKTRKLMGEAKFSGARSRYILMVPTRALGLDSLDHLGARIPIGAQYFTSAIASE